MTGVARPYQTDAARSLRPKTRLLRVENPVTGKGQRDIARLYPKKQGEAHQRAVAGKFRPWIILANAGVNAWSVFEETPQFGLHFQDHSTAPRCNERDKAGKLDRIAQSLLCVQENDSTVQGLAFPDRLRETARRRGEPAPLPTPLVFLPAPSILAMQQQRRTQVPVGNGGRRLFVHELLEVAEPCLVPGKGKGQTQVAAHVTIP